MALALLLASAECRSLVVVALRWRFPRAHRPEQGTAAHAAREWPAITVQIPAYREDRVLPRLLEAIERLDYSRDRLTVQVLDDTEEPQAQRTRDVLQPYLPAGRVRFDYLHRPDRRGYKAGNLNHVTSMTTAPLIAVLDDDCVPEPGFLRTVVLYLDDRSIGAVQARWGYLNDWHSPLTLAQGAVLDTLFCFENGLRKRWSQSGFFFGSGGIWRREAIVSRPRTSTCRTAPAWRDGASPTRSSACCDVNCRPRTWPTRASSGAGRAASCNSFATTPDSCRAKGGSGCWRPRCCCERPPRWCGSP